jgi:hypothetical protein
LQPGRFPCKLQLQCKAGFALELKLARKPPRLQGNGAVCKEMRTA